MVDEYGGTDGVVTLEDLVEEIVGDIADEHDRLYQHSRHRGDGTWSISGLLRPDEVLAQTGVPLPEGDDYETVAGLVLDRLGRLAERGDEIVLAVEIPGEDPLTLAPASVRIRVERMEGRRIDRIALEVLATEQGGVV